MAGWTRPGEVRILRNVAFRDRLVATIHAARTILEMPEILVIGSEVPNLLEPDAASTLVVSLDLDIGVPVQRQPAVKARLGDLLEFTPSPDEPSVWTPHASGLLEVHFVGMDSGQDPLDVYLLEDDRLPLMVFGTLSLVRAGMAIEIEGTRVRVPRLAGLLLEKLLTDRTGEKGERDLLVALGLLNTASPADHDEFCTEYQRLRPELRHVVQANMTLLSLMEPLAGMPDPRPRRGHVAALLRRLDIDGGGRS